MGSLREVGPGWTAREFRELPEGTRCQLIEGELVMSPSPRFFHQQVVLNLALMIRVYLDGRPGTGTVVVAPMDVYLTEIDAYQPDVVFVADASRATIREDGVHGGPELVIEVLSPGSEKHDLGRKKCVYAESGVIEYWVVDPDARRAQVFSFAESVDAPVATYWEGDAFETPLLPGLRVEVARVFARG
jgi:Uma2 family endonuclease